MRLNKVKVSCKHCRTDLAVEDNFSGMIRCPKCGIESEVNTTTQEKIEISSAPDFSSTADSSSLIYQELRKLTWAVENVSRAIWIVFFWIPFAVGFVWGLSVFL